MPEINRVAEAGEFEDGVLLLSGAYRVSTTRGWAKTEMSALPQGDHTEGANMNRDLDKIEDWLGRAQQANWSCAELARLCGVSKETLRQYFIRQLGKPPGRWLAEQRQNHAVELLLAGASVKETALRLGYKQQTNFTRKFKKFWGNCPSSPGREGVARADLRK